MPGLARAYEPLGRQAREEHWTHEDYLHEALAAEQASRLESAIRHRIHDARFPEIKTPPCGLVGAGSLRLTAAVWSLHTANVERPLNAGPTVRLLAIAFIQSGRGGRDSVEQTVASGGGEVLQVRDPLVIAAFESSVDCVSACLALGADVRAGVSCGDIVCDGEMFQGVPVIEASRLMDRATPGEILCADRLVTVCGLKRCFSEARSFELKGLAAPLSARALLRSSARRRSLSPRRSPPNR
jgi:hypothetical protein